MLRTMTVVRIVLSQAEYELLRRRSKTEGRSKQEIVREALRAYLLPDRFVPDDPLFKAFPRARGRRGTDRTSERVDDVVYGSRR